MVDDRESHRGFVWGKGNKATPMARGWRTQIPEGGLVFEESPHSQDARSPAVLTRVTPLQAGFSRHDSISKLQLIYVQND